MKDLASRLSEVEHRVRALVAENRSLRVRVQELEGERDAIGAQARDAARLRERAAEVRERLQRLLARLEALEQEQNVVLAEGTGPGDQRSSGAFPADEA